MCFFRNFAGNSGVLDGVSNILRMTAPGPERDAVATLIEECGGITFSQRFHY